MTRSRSWSKSGFQIGSVRLLVLTKHGPSSDKKLWGVVLQDRCDRLSAMHKICQDPSINPEDRTDRRSVLAKFFRVALFDWVCFFLFSFSPKSRLTHQARTKMLGVSPWHFEDERVPWPWSKTNIKTLKLRQNDVTAFPSMPPPQKKT